ncbi:chloride channel protein [Pandoraea thiooxydans]|uniref:chloride channel protein n=1 Tax=Pandoraea thiooxydans TaxID=445709 RepID=UPI00094A8F7F|nr:chloride channel protein [Pandoraea thiooxydans]APR96013.1 chloride channel protein [Pandoraea thiooxydans]
MLFRPRQLSSPAVRHLQRLWFNYGVFWLGAILVGLVAVFYAKLIDWTFEIFQSIEHRAFWLPLIITPLGSALAIWLTQKYFRGSEGSGIPQVIATLEESKLGPTLLSFRIMFGKIAISLLGILCGFTIGREGPTVQVGASLMYGMRRTYRRSSIQIERQLALAGAAAGLSAAFNTPLAGVVFAIEELSRSFEQRASGTLITAIIFSGIVTLGIQGNYLYFGRIQATGAFSSTVILAVVVISIVTGLMGGLFSWLLLNISRWIPSPLLTLRHSRPVQFALVCGALIAVLGIVSGGTTYGSGYAEARGLLEAHHLLSPFYAFLKFAALVVSYISGIPGGIFSPSLSIGAGLGQLLSYLFSSIPMPFLIALCMGGYLAAVTQAPITAFVIVVEMIDGHQMVIPLMACALLSSRVSRLFSRPLYHTISHRFLQPTVPAPERA